MIFTWIFLQYAHVEVGFFILKNFIFRFLAWFCWKFLVALYIFSKKKGIHIYCICCMCTYMLYMYIFHAFSIGKCSKNIFPLDSIISSILHSENFQHLLEIHWIKYIYGKYSFHLGPFCWKCFQICVCENICFFPCTDAHLLDVHLLDGKSLQMLCCLSCVDFLFSIFILNFFFKFYVQKFVKYCK